MPGKRNPTERALQRWTNEGGAPEGGRGKYRAGVKKRAPAKKVRKKRG